MKFHRESRFWRCWEKSGTGYTAMTVPICIFTTISNGMQKNAWEYLYLNPDPVIAKLYDGQLAKSNEALQLLRSGPLFLDAASYPFLMAEIDAAMNEMRNFVDERVRITSTSRADDTTIVIEEKVNLDEKNQ